MCEITGGQTELLPSDGEFEEVEETEDPRVARLLDERLCPDCGHSLRDDSDELTHKLTCTNTDECGKEFGIDD